MGNFEPRRKLRAWLAGSKCLSPASVYDPLSARVAESAGFELGLLSGSIVAAATLSAPDLLVHTLTEYADQARRIMRVSNLSLFVDADYGYGNALNVMRTVHELEHAGLSGIGIEDTVGPIRFGQDGDDVQMVSIEEGVGKMRMAVAARHDPSLVIAARTWSLHNEGIEGAIARARAYAETGVDAIWITTLEDLDQLQAIHSVAKLPIVVGTLHGDLTNDEVAPYGARIMLQGHLPVRAAVKALFDTYAHLFEGDTPVDLAARVASEQEMASLTSSERYALWLQEYIC